MKDLEKKIKEAAKIHIDKGDEYNRILCGHSFIQGAKSPEAKEYWQERMIKEEKVLSLLEEFALYAGLMKDEVDVKKWFDANKKK